jgi:hypothetical protein
MNHSARIFIETSHVIKQARQKSIALPVAEHWKGNHLLERQDEQET